MFPIPCSHFCTLNDAIRYAAHGCAVHAETTLGHPVFELVQERNSPLLIIHVNLHPSGQDLGMIFKLCSQRVVVRGEKAHASNVGGNVMQDGLSDGDAIIGACASSKFVEDDE